MPAHTCPACCICSTQAKLMYHFGQRRPRRDLDLTVGFSKPASLIVRSLLRNFSLSTAIDPHSGELSIVMLRVIWSRL